MSGKKWLWRQSEAKRSPRNSLFRGKEQGISVIWPFFVASRRWKFIAIRGLRLKFPCLRTGKYFGKTAKFQGRIANIRLSKRPQRLPRATHLATPLGETSACFDVSARFARAGSDLEAVRHPRPLCTRYRTSVTDGGHVRSGPIAEVHARLTADDQPMTRQATLAPTSPANHPLRRAHHLHRGHH